VVVFQTEEEREWFASAMERQTGAAISKERKVSLAKLMLRCQVEAHKIVLSGI
jgi:hypothetical protein